MDTMVRARSMLWLATVTTLALVMALVMVWGSGSWRASASFGPEESTLVPVTPTRILDTRDPVNLGLDGPFVSAVSQELRVTGQIPTADGVQTVVPEGATGVVLNVTVVEPTAAGFVSVRPAGTPGAPTTSSLNFEAGVIVPNSVSVQVPTSGSNAGRIELTYDAFGVQGPTTDMLIDVVAYTSNAGLADLAARVSALEAQAADTASSLQSLDQQLGAKVDSCTDGAVMAGAYVSTMSASFTEMSGFSCSPVKISARRVSQGTYQVRWDGFDLQTTDANFQLTAAGPESGGRVVGYFFDPGAQADTLTVRTRRSDDDTLADTAFIITVFSAPVELTILDD